MKRNQDPINRFIASLSTLQELQHHSLSSFSFSSSVFICGLLGSKRQRDHRRKREKERKLASLPYLIRSNFIKTTYDISLDSQISFLPLGFSPPGPPMTVNERARKISQAPSNGSWILNHSFCTVSQGKRHNIMFGKLLMVFFLDLSFLVIWEVTFRFLDKHLHGGHNFINDSSMDILSLVTSV